MPTTCARAPFALQVTEKDGTVRPAKAPTHEELWDVIENTWDKLKKDARVPQGFVPFWSLDNARVHVSCWTTFVEDWKKTGRMPPGAFGAIQPPPYGPDMHKVIEHVIGTVSKAFKEEVRRMTYAHDSIEEYFQIFKRIFEQKITAQSVQRDIDSLLETYRQVIVKHGGWPDPKYR